MAGRKLSPAWVFCLKFGAIYALSLAALVLLERTVAGPWLIHTTARTCAWSLRLVDAQARVQDAFVYSRLGEMEVIYECTALFPVSVFVSAVLAFPASWASRATGILGGSAAITLLNHARLLSLLWISTAHPSRFDTAHLVVWPALLISAVILTWLAWVRKVLRREVAAAS
jgi:exosortase/archaeosortase family protein